MDPQEYRDARWYSLLRSAVELSVPEEDAGQAHPHKKEGAFYLWDAKEIDQLADARARRGAP